ncbi:TlpA family protein disulfide reductase [Aquimarina sp. M1]
MNTSHKKSLLPGCFFFIIVFIFYSCKEDKNDDLNYILSQYKEASDNISKISYTIKRLDSFAQGGVWDLEGYTLIERKQNDPVLGYHFYGHNQTFKFKNLYDGKDAYRIDDNENTLLSIFTNSSILSEPGGQMVSKYLFSLDTVYKSIRLLKDKDHYKVRYDYEIDPEENQENAYHYNIIYLDKQTFLPKKVTRHYTQLGNKANHRIELSGIKINEEVTDNIIERKRELTNYKYIGREEGTKTFKYLNKQLPKITLTELFDMETSYTVEVGNKLILLDFWEIWCSACIKSFPTMEELNQKYKNQVEIIGILSEDKEKAKQIIKKKQVTYLNLLGEDILDTFEITALPTYLLIDKKGVVRHNYFGMDKEKLVNDIETLLKE